MEKLLLWLVMGLLLSGCVTAPTQPAPNELWYAAKELPAERYQVYVYFKDDHQFIWWRTTESPDVVMKRWKYYTNDHPGVDNPTPYTRQGDLVKGEKIIINNNSKGVYEAKTVQTFTGHVSGDNMEMELKSEIFWADSSSWPPDTVRWSMKRFNTLPR